MEEISMQTRARSLITHEGHPDVTLERDEPRWLFLSNKTQDVFIWLKVKSLASWQTRRRALLVATLKRVLRGYSLALTLWDSRRTKKKIKIDEAEPEVLSFYSMHSSFWEPWISEQNFVSSRRSRYFTEKLKTLTCWWCEIKSLMITKRLHDSSSWNS